MALSAPDAARRRESKRRRRSRADGTVWRSRDAQLVRTHEAARYGILDISLDGTRSTVERRAARCRARPRSFPSTHFFPPSPFPFPSRASKWRGPEAVTLRRPQDCVVGCEATNEVVAVDTAATSRGGVKTGASPRGIAFNPDNKTAFVARNEANSDSRCDGAQAVEPSRFPPNRARPARPMGARDHRDGRQLFLVAGQVLASSTVARKFIGPLRRRHSGVGPSSSARRQEAETANGGSGTSRSSTSKPQGEKRITTGGSRGVCRRGHPPLPSRVGQ